MTTTFKKLLMAGAIVTLSSAAYAGNYSASDQRTGTTQQQQTRAQADMTMDQRLGQRIDQRVDERVDERLSQRLNLDPRGQAHPGQQEQVSSSDIRNIQQTLRNEGYSIAVDGLWGPQTRQAVRSYQAQNNLSVTGELDNQTITRMNMDRSTRRN